MWAAPGRGTAIVAGRSTRSLGIIGEAPVEAFIVLYRWKLKPGAENSFVDAWSRITTQLRASGGSLGSRLHRGSDQIWYGYAQWPNEEMRRTAFERLIDRDLAARMKSAVAESMPEVVLECVADHLIPLEAA